MSILSRDALHDLSGSGPGRSLGAAGRERILRELTLDWMIRRFEALYLLAAGRQIRSFDGDPAVS